ncbi:MAG: hypothetical protein IPI44_20600 [Sulfuritalea sp.]|nr:hypothetical protein [Sulfuritalea sp.]
MLIAKQAQGKFRILRRIVAVPAGKGAILIVLGQKMAAIAQKGERIEAQRVDGAQPK